MLAFTGRSSQDPTETRSPAHPRRYAVRGPRVSAMRLLPSGPNSVLEETLSVYLPSFRLPRRRVPTRAVIGKAIE